MSKGIQSLHGVQPGDLYTIDGKDVWEVRHFAEQPTITLRNLRTQEHLSGAVGSLLMADFVKLSTPMPLETPKPSEGNVVMKGEQTVQNAQAFSSLSPGASAVYGRYLELELEMQKLLVYHHPTLRPLLRLRETSPAELLQHLPENTQPILEHLLGLFQQSPVGQAPTTHDSVDD